MKKRNKLLTLLLCAALITVNLPVSSSAVYAAGDAAEPSRTAYADKTGLQENYDLVDSPVVVDGKEIDKPVQKVYFGYAGDSAKTPQVWKIAGKDTEIVDGEGNKIENNIVLFADTPITGITTQKKPTTERQYIEFEENWTSGSTEKDTDETELKSLGITYNSSYPTKVNFNHYGTSTLRDVLKGMLKDSQGNMVTKYFTAAQQDLMNETTITTNDTKNNVNYTTTDVLYAPYGYFAINDYQTNPDCRYVTVGTNNKDGNLNDGLKIDRSNWLTGDIFWLRAPDVNIASNALVAVPSKSVGAYSVVVSDSVVPAFDLNLTDVLFASSAKKVTVAEAGVKNLSDGTYDAMTFRWVDKEGNDAKIKSTATWTASEVNVTNNDGNEDVFLCVQGNNDDKDWIWSKKVNDVTSPITADTIASALKTSNVFPDTPAVDLTKCEIWFETTDTTDGLTYAKEAQALTYSVKITAGTGLEISNGTQTVVQEAEIKPITVKAKSGYHLMAENIKAIEAQLNPSGLTLKETDAGFTISGTPQRDVDITINKVSKGSSNPAYATKEDLQTRYDLDGGTIKTVQKVYFGYNGNGGKQAWKIAGKDEGIKDGDGNTIDNIVLFADSAITGITTPNDKTERQKIKFEENWTSGSTEKTTKEDDLKKSGITYKDDNYPNKVYFNHYGTSTLRDVLKGMLKDSQGNMVTKYFTAAQQALMNETTITTNDTKNSKNYTTKDVLYAPYGYFDPAGSSDNPDCHYVTVGTNKEVGGSLNNGLKIDGVINNEEVWGNNIFWLRAPLALNDDYALVANPGNYVDPNFVDLPNSVVPAFDLNLTNVLFASKATAATQSADAKIDEKDTMTLRWKDTGNKIKSTAIATKKAVNLTKNDGANEVYLCVQGNNDGKDWIWSKKVNEINENKVTAQTIANEVQTSKALTDTALDLTTCQIWLETTTDGLTYAKQAQTGTDGQSQGNNGNKGINTGDESNPALWIALMLIALAGAGGTAIYSKKKKAK